MVGSKGEALQAGHGVAGLLTNRRVCCLPCIQALKNTEEASHALKRFPVLPG